MLTPLKQAYLYSWFSLRWNMMRNGFKAAPVPVLVGIVFAAVVLVGIFMGVQAFLHYIQEQLLGTYSNTVVGKAAANSIQKIIADRSLASLLLLMTSANVLSALPAAVSVLYTSEDLPLHLVLPQPPARVFLNKVLDVFMSTSLLPAVFALPVIYAFGAFYQAPWMFYPLATVLILALFCFPVFIGVALALPLVRFAPAGKAREWSAAVGAVLGGGLIFVLRALKPEALLKANFADPEALDAFLEGFRSPSSPLLPSALASQALDGLFGGSIVPQFWWLCGLALALLLTGAFVSGFAYQQGWVRTLEGTVAPRALPKASKLDHWISSHALLALWWRDLKLFFRDANQASQLILVAVLVLLYTTSLGYIQVPEGAPQLERAMKTVVMFLHLGFEAFVIGGIGVRLAFPLFSLEGQGYWMLQTAPVSHRLMVLSRFGLALIMLLPTALVLGYFSVRTIDVPASMVTVSVVVAVSAALVAAAAGVGFGTAFPKLDAANPTEIAFGTGALLYMGAIMLHALVLSVLAARPVYFTHQGTANYIAGPEGAGWLAVVAGVTVLMCAVYLWIGLRAKGSN